VSDPLDVRIFPDTALRLVVPPMTTFDEPGSKNGELRQLVLAMGGVCRVEGGAGLAATQIGRFQRMFVLMETNKPPDKAGAFAFCNPEIIGRSSESEVVTEGCLSLPGLGIDVERSLAIKLRFQDTWGQEREEEFIGWDARVIQHETDHLNGALMIDYIDRREWFRMFTAWKEHTAAGQRYRHAA
jgi:peptide deformylase